MKKILVTGATGNVGRVVCEKLSSQASVSVFAGVRNVSRAQTQMGLDFVQYCHLDFEQKIYPSITFDTVFLVRPPHLAQADIFEAYLKSLSATTKVVFLSVQGADRMLYLPHAKIEKLIKNRGFKHIFIRPSYFMENITTTLWDELQKNQRIYLPSKDLKFNWIAIEDIAELAVIALLTDLEHNSLEVCNSSRHSFAEVIELINRICGTHFEYQSPSVWRYLVYSLMQKQKIAYILIMLLLHFMPRFSRPQKIISEDYLKLTGKSPQSLEAFIHKNQALFQTIRAK